MKIEIDFLAIGDYEDFYTQIKEKITLPENFGDHLDDLSDAISGALAMPMHFEFVNLSVDQLEIFEDVLSLLEDLEEEIDGFSFSYYLEQYEDEE